MANYIDGFVLPIPRTQLDEYLRLVAVVAEIWREHGALDYREFVSNDLDREDTGSFIKFSDAAVEEVVIFGWVEFSSREQRDSVNHKVANDPRMPALVAASNTGFDSRRMAYGGFQALLSTAM